MTKQQTQGSTAREAVIPKDQKTKAAIADKAAKDAAATTPKAEKVKEVKPPRERVKPEDSKNVIDRDKYKYPVHEVKTAGGRKATDNNDGIADALRGHDVDYAKAALTANGGEWNSAWDKLNPGMQRMNVGNKLRGLMRSNGQIKIGDVVIKDPNDTKAKADAAAEQRAKEKAEREAKKADEAKAKEAAKAAEKAAAVAEKAKEKPAEAKTEAKDGAKKAEAAKK